MKRFFLLFILSLFLALPVFAKNTPLYSTAINVEGIGVIKLPQYFRIYIAPDTNSKVVTEFMWGEKAGSYVLDTDYSDNFVLMNEEKNLAFMVVTSDLETGGWYEVCYDQKNKLTGWIYIEDYEFYPWISFFTKYGKLNGVYFFKDLPQNQKKLYSQPDEESQVINTFKLIKDARVQIFKGDWVLLRVYDYEGNLKIGWFKWRSDDGKFFLFPRVK